jgi:dTMP kinase
MKLITFEGIEGVGKSTQINLVLDWLKNKGFSTKLLREPGSTNFGEKLENYFYLRNLIYPLIQNYC